MAHVIVSARAREDLVRLRFTHRLPLNTWARVLRSVDHLTFAPLAGRAMSGDLEGFRSVLGPWPWMVIVYRYWEEIDAVAILRVYDGRSEEAPRA